MAELAGAHFLGQRRRAEEGIDFALGKQFHRIEVWRGKPIDILGGIEPDTGRDDDEHQVGDSHKCIDADSLAFEIADTVDRVIGEQFKAAGMHAGQDLDRHAIGDQAHMGGREVPVEIDLAMAYPIGGIGSGARADEFDVGDALAVQQRFGYIKGRLAVGQIDQHRQADAGDLWRRLGDGRACVQTGEQCRKAGAVS